MEDSEARSSDIGRFIKNKTITKAILQSRQDSCGLTRNDPISPRDDQMCVLARVRSCEADIFNKRPNRVR